MRLPGYVVHIVTKYYIPIETAKLNTSVASFTQEVNPRLAKRPLKTNGRLANLGLTSLVKEATGRYLLTSLSVECLPAAMEAFITTNPRLHYSLRIWIRVSQQCDVSGNLTICLNRQTVQNPPCLLTLATGPTYHGL